MAKTLSSKGISVAILVIVIIVVLFEIYAALVPQAQAAGDKLNITTTCANAGCYWNSSSAVCEAAIDNASSCDSSNTSVPLGSLFSAGGIVFVILMAALFIALVISILPKKK